ncbi:spore gernimation protein GerC [Thermoclostridium stercorarium subsp. leptospartum DSM 9219]|uniref:Spore gernimation protein GerC n=1 Tax=Thermoclostridium stercorarium subsp. leptospartum DSM 9219 TaxID=1346611 RepID=A0A1B1YIL4_THEST|nr:Ger(x)C family spore germination protein [Thermoclostridium stercorarium]ANX00598.1 spore gernimation protein GerC [Thermoclostridium stercorarium subsp. leptospartum DSM 9219]
MRTKAVLLSGLIFTLLVLTSCWNYREVNEIAIVIGAAVDKGKTSKYMLTVEILDVSRGLQTQVSSKILSVEGETIFDAVRRLISVEGKRGYWGHARVVLIGEELARENISEVINFFRHDAETRGDLYVIISKGCRAGEILNAGIPLGQVLSETLARSLENSKFLSEVPETRLYTLTQDIKSDKIALTLPTVTLETVEDKIIPVFCGAAVFQRSKMIDHLEKEEVKAMLFLKNEINSGVIVTEMGTERISLEIFGNNTKMKIRENEDQVIFDVTVETSVVIEELTDSIDYSDLAVLNEIKEMSEAQLKGKLQSILDKARQLRADIFGFEQKLYEDNPGKWVEMSENYDTVFSGIQVDLSVNINILNTSILYNQLNEGK